MSLIHIDKSGILAWHMTAEDTDGEIITTLGFTSNNNNVDQIANKAFLRFGANVMPLLSQLCHLHKVTCVMQLGANKESSEQFSTGDIAGGGPTSRLPSNTAVLVQKRTAFAGRKNRGRFYIGGLPIGLNEADHAPSALTAAKLLTWQAAFDAFYDSLKDSDDGDPIVPVILHPPPATASTEVVAFSVQARFATQRGRMR